MAATTVTEYKSRPCIRCSGAGFLSSFQHYKGGECFRCGATGNDPVMFEVTRDMDYAEMIAALSAKGVDIVRIETGDYLHDLFVSDEEVEGVRMLLASL